MSRPTIALTMGDAAGIEKELERAKQEREKLSMQPTVSA